MKIYIARAYLILAWLFQTTTPTTVEVDFSKIKDIMSHILGLQMKNIQIHNDEDGRRSGNVDASIIEIEIENKIEDLKDSLQDDNDVVEKTTIVEFVPKSDKTEDVEKRIEIEQYNKVRQSIDVVLSKSSVPERKKKLILIAFDDLISQLLSKQCVWNNAFDSPKFKSGDNTTDLLKVWKDQFEKLKSNDMSNSNPTFIAMLKPYHNLFLQMLQDFNSLSKDYEIKCDLVHKKKIEKFDDDELDKPNIREFRRNGREKIIKDGCKNFRVCSNELKGFLKHFHETLNDTASTAFKAYVDMYDKENDEKNTTEGKKVSLVMEKTIEYMPKIVTKVFIKELGTFELAKSKNSAKNIQIIKDFVENTIKALKDKIRSLLKNAMEVVSRKTRDNVIVDVKENLDLELGNLVKDTHDKICLIFDSCKGIVVKRRAFVTEKKPKNKGSRLFEINLNVDLDDEAADIIFHNNRRSNNDIITEASKDQEEITTISENEYKNISLTRTTVETASSTTDTEGLTTDAASSTTDTDSSITDTASSTTDTAVPRYPQIVEITNTPEVSDVIEIKEANASEESEVIEITTNMFILPTRTTVVVPESTVSNMNETSTLSFSNATNQNRDAIFNLYLR